MNIMQEPRDKNNDKKLQDEKIHDLLYPANEDILNPSSKMERVDLDMDNITRRGTGPGVAKSQEETMENLASEEPVDDLDLAPGTEADVTEDDLLSLGSIDRDMDLGEDEELQNKGFPLGRTGDDLDVPGEELDDADEEVGEEDEENNYYSLGGDSKD
jgi:hypothetical protein